ncbi:MAG: formylmethanofuran dehydrogenase [Methanolobus sp.]|uniref:formylmethanofuran dehydrogenase n=1 Tax=Methanolobus sp. TaxID=1874737 RepID=UPI002730238E|nr:formylmethanofuran dehydrogenase [Methanolobus sp.]MDP2216168.1 formylmethanofuran dehydrogenase [Methanolobus sp.]
MPVKIELTASADYLLDYTFNFHWHNKSLDPDSLIPFQKDTKVRYRDLVMALKNGKDVKITGNVGRNFAYSAGVDVQHLGGSGNLESAGRIFVDGDVGPEAAMGMVAGTLYVSGSISEPLGNIIEVRSDIENYRKFRSITDIVCNGPGKDFLVSNSYNPDERTLLLNDGILRGTIGARCTRPLTIRVEGDAYNGTGVLMREGMVIVNGNAGMNTGSHLNGGTVAVLGSVGEFAGAYMKCGILAFKDAKGYIGAGMTRGTIYSRSRVKTNPPVGKVRMGREDAALMHKIMEAGRIDAALYNKYELEPEKEKYIEVRMRDGSIVLRKAD